MKNAETVREAVRRIALELGHEGAEARTIRREIRHWVIGLLRDEPEAAQHILHAA